MLAQVLIFRKKKKPIEEFQEARNISYFYREKSNYIQIP